MSEGGRAAFYLGLLLAALAAVFAHGFGNEATAFDDLSLVIHNPKLTNFGGAELREAFDPRAPRTWFGLQYTPLSDLSYALDHKLFGDREGPYHLQGILFHALAAAALFALVRRQGGSPECALLAGALFALHPLEVEAVTWISGRRTAMAGAFMLCAMLAWQRRRSSRAAYAASIVFALLANLSKQSAVVVAPLLAAVELTAPRPPGAPREPRWKTALAYLPHVGLTIAFVAIGISVGRREGLIVAGARSAAERAELALVAATAYGRMLVYPAHLQPIYRIVMPEGFGDPRVLGGIAIALGGLAFVAAAWRRAPLAAFGALLAGIAIAPGLHALGSQVVADRYAYLTVAGAAIPAALLLEAIARRERTIGAGLAAALVAGLATATFLRIEVWRNDVTLFSDAIASDPENDNSRCLYGVGLVAAGRVEAGEAELMRAAARASAEPPKHGRWIVPLALMAAGGARELGGDLRGAESALRTAVLLAREREVDLPACTLAGFYVRRGAPEKARETLLAAIERDPEHTPFAREALAALP